MNTQSASSPRPRRRRWTILAGLAVAMLAAAAMAWLFRMALAEMVASRWCDRAGLTCSLDITRLDLSHVEVEALNVRGEGGTPLEAQRVRAEFDWAGFASPQLTAIDVDAPIVRARFDGDDVDLYGLEQVFPQGEGGGESQFPAVTISNGRAGLETPAGTVTGTVDLTLETNGDGTAEIAIAPAELVQGDDRLSLDGGTASLSRQGEEIRGEIDLKLISAELGSFQAGPTRLSAQIDPGRSDQPIRAQFDLSSETFRYGGDTVTGLTGTGRFSLDPADGEISLSNLRAALVQLTAGHIEAGAISGEAIAIDLDLTLQDEALSGPVAVSADRLEHAGWGSLASGRAVGDMGLSSDGALSYRGGVTAPSISIAPNRRADWTGFVSLPSLLDAHQSALVSTLDRALSDFSLGLDLEVERTPALDDEPSQWQIAARRPAQLSAASSLSLSLRPFSEGPWARFDSQAGLTARGQIAVSGGGGPTVQTQLNELSVSAGAQSLSFGPSSLSDWRVGGLSIAASLDRLTWQSDSEGARLTTSGEVGLDGRFVAVDLDRLSLFGGIEARRDTTGWRAQTQGNPCLGLTWVAAELAAVRMGEVAASLCPPRGRLVQPAAGGGLSGALGLGTLDLPVTIGGIGGTFELASGQLDWRSGGETRFGLTGDTFGLDLALQSGALEFDGVEPRFDTVLAPGRRPQMSGILGEIAVGGTVLPARVSIGAVEFDLTAETEGLAGTARLSDTQVSDFRDDPLYRPIVADLDAVLRGGDLELTGPIRLATSQREVAALDLSLTIPSLDGSATIRTEGLRFDPFGLQPQDLSDQVRGIFTDASGALSAQADIDIRGGALSGTGDVTVSDLGFQTLALGRVSGVNGAIHFDDLLALHTPPGQEVRIAQIDPGLPLENGTVRFQLQGPGLARLESALWPFAGGVLAVEPTEWRVGAERRTVTVRADAIELSALTELLELPDFRAEGTVAGRFPIELIAGNAFIRNARLAADGRGGSLSYTGATGQQAGSGNESVALAFDALRNFDFTVLEIGADGNVAGQIVLTARLEGRNPEVLGGQAFNFNVSIDSQLGQLLSSSRRLTGTDWLAEISARETPE